MPELNENINDPKPKDNPDKAQGNPENEASENKAPENEAPENNAPENDKPENKAAGNKAPEIKRDPNVIRIDMSNPFYTWRQLHQVKDPGKLVIANPEAIGKLDDFYSTKKRQAENMVDAGGEARKTRFDKIADRLDPGKLDNPGSLIQWFVYVSFKMISEYNKGYREAQAERMRMEAESIRQLSARLKAEQKKIEGREKQKSELDKSDRLMQEIQDKSRENPQRNENEPQYEEVGDEKNSDFLEEVRETLEDMPDTPERHALLESIEGYRDYFEKNPGADEGEVYSQEGKDFYDRLDKFMGKNGDLSDEQREALSKLSPEMKEGLENLMERRALNTSAQNEKDKIFTEEQEEREALYDAEDEKEDAFDNYREAQALFEAAQSRNEANNILRENAEKERDREVEQLQRDSEKLNKDIEASKNEGLENEGLKIPNEAIWISGADLESFKNVTDKMDLSENLEKLKLSVAELNGVMGQKGLHEREYVSFYKNVKDFLESSKDSKDPLVQEARKEAQELAGRLEINDRIGKLQKLDNYHASIEKLNKLNDTKANRVNFWEENIQEIAKRAETIKREMDEKKASLDQSREALNEKRQVLNTKNVEAPEKAANRAQRMKTANEQIEKAKMMREAARQKRLEKRNREPKKESERAFTK